MPLFLLILGVQPSSLASLLVSRALIWYVILLGPAVRWRGWSSVEDPVSAAASARVAVAAASRAVAASRAAAASALSVASMIRYSSRILVGKKAALSLSLCSLGLECCSRRASEN
jgi:hypothetical protein